MALRSSDAYDPASRRRCELDEGDGGDALHLQPQGVTIHTDSQRFLEHDRFLIFHVITKKRKYSRWKSETTHEFCTFRAFLKAAVRNAFSIVESRRSTAALITSLNVPVSGGTVCQATPV